jgi:MFS family permease
VISEHDLGTGVADHFSIPSAVGTARFLDGVRPRSQGPRGAAVGRGGPRAVAVYAYSIFKPAVEKVYGVNAFQGNLPFMVFLFSFAVTMFFGGRLMDRIGPRRLALIGGLIVGLGWALSSLATSIGMLVLTYGVVAGAGVGLPRLAGGRGAGPPRRRPRSILLATSLAMLRAGENTTILYVASFAGFWLCLGGWLAIAPAQRR